MADNLREIVDFDELIFLSEAANESSADGELKCLRFTKGNILADVAQIIFDGSGRFVIAP